MDGTRYVIKITPVDNSAWPCECSYLGTSYDCGSNLYPCVTKEELFKYAYKTYKGAEIGYKCRLARYYSMPCLESWEWWNKIRLLPKKERDRLLLERYEQIKDSYVAEIMTVDEAWSDWTDVFCKKE